MDNESEKTLWRGQWLVCVEAIRKREERGFAKARARGEGKFLKEETFSKIRRFSLRFYFTPLFPSLCLIFPVEKLGFQSAGGAHRCFLSPSNEELYAMRTLCQAPDLFVRWRSLWPSASLPFNSTSCVCIVYRGWEGKFAPDYHSLNSTSLIRWKYWCKEPIINQN